ncbi:7406_t:CDS:1 [Funneliformis geosporum]|uniref:14346_t:CDS:1 n=1 Tax=Funneliformis geosporum TaxID=1117311 RepID=A0A9W4WJJ0_9GLOM|nr:14346_t:CDS:1 [Funneliformis geosporum]CAI2185110.1 7406_t:CDS:1 [Funneliformis geosporum]
MNTSTTSTIRNIIKRHRIKGQTEMNIFNKWTQGKNGSHIGAPIPSVTATAIQPQPTTTNTLFSKDNPNHKPFMAGMIIAVIIAVIFIGYILKKIFSYNARKCPRPLLDATSSLESNSNISHESSIHHNICDTFPSNPTEESASEGMYHTNSNTIEILDIPNPSATEHSYETSSVGDVDIELPSSKVNVNWEDCMR